MIIRFLGAVMLSLSLSSTGIAQSSHAAGGSGVDKINLLPPGPGNERNSEGDFIQLKDGRLLFIYSHFTDSLEDNGNSYLASRVSSDGGKTWSKEDVVVLKNEKAINLMSVSLLRLKNGKIALFFLRKHSLSDCRPMMATSRDEGKTWSKPVMCINDEAGYYVVNNDRVIQLKSGRLVIPAAVHVVTEMATGLDITPGKGMCYLSDDNGRTWRRSNVIEPPKESRGGIQEPLVIELNDGRLMFLARSDMGCQLRSWSADGGATWSHIEKSDIISPLSPATLKRIPKTGDLLLVWNDHKNVDAADRWRRSPLNVAISKDEGKTWQKEKVIEDNPDGWYCYTTVEFAGNRVLLAYCATEPPLGHLQQTRFAYFDLEWLYK